MTLLDTYLIGIPAAVVLLWVATYVARKNDLVQSLRPSARVLLPVFGGLVWPVLVGLYLADSLWGDDCG